MSDYHINVFWSDEDKGYIADIPDLEGCSAFGETPEQALAEVALAKTGLARGGSRHGSIGPRTPLPPGALRGLTWRRRSSSGWTTTRSTSPASSPGTFVMRACRSTRTPATISWSVTTRFRRLWRWS